ncbi:MAG: hypothetical protein IID45_09605, partial [Planctomycetes bacterium]|nr:hypothetical protein [Planctomycetota bacterium]
GKTSTEPASPEQGNFEVEFDVNRLSVIGDLKKSVAEKSVQVIDARTADEYQSGCIPDAVHLNWENLVTTDNRFLSDKELKQRFEAAGVDPDKPAITYCQTGGRASLNAYALELAGYKNVRNYYSSWRQWRSDDSAPKETPKPPAKPIKTPAPKG